MLISGGDDGVVNYTKLGGKCYSKNTRVIRRTVYLQASPGENKRQLEAKKAAKAL